MAKSLNKVMIIGNVGSDPETRKTGSGTMVANLSVATNDGKDGEKTNWHRIVAFGKLAEIIEQYVSKGDRLYVEGRLQYGQYEKDGHTVYTTDVIAREVNFLGGQGNGGKRKSNTPPSKADASDDAPWDEEDDDLPF